MAAQKTKKLDFKWSESSRLEAHWADSPQSKQKCARVMVVASQTWPKDWRDMRAHDAEGGKPLGSRWLDCAEGVRLLLTPFEPAEGETESLLRAQSAVRVRDAMGPAVSSLEKANVQWAEFDLDLPDALVGAALLGLELALYRFRRVLKGEEPKLRVHVKVRGRALTLPTLRRDAQLMLGQATNFARHLVNLPPNWLNPDTFSKWIESSFRGLKGVRVEVWDHARLKRENMGLHLGVGQGSETPPCLVHIRYRPAKRASGSKAPIALVGKGITFDTGGLDIKPSAGMRLMKKDMGGAAAVVGVAYWAARTELMQNLDVYVALAENSIGGSSFRPSDVLVSRSGQTVEIHNTDAEGRLVLADALDVAVTQNEKPAVVVDVATLTGAIKVALGAHLAGLFTNDAQIVRDLQKASSQSGDWLWHMPLVQKYKSSMNSNFADMVNATDGFGGAVTAALFLEKFVKDARWAHLDIYAWKDSAEGPWLESGGSGQGVPLLAEWLLSFGRGRGVGTRTRPRAARAKSK